MSLDKLREVYRILWIDRRVKVLISALIDLSGQFRENPAWRSTRAQVANEISIDPEPFVLRLKAEHETTHEICLQQIVCSLRRDLTSGIDHAAPGQLTSKGESKLALMIDALWILQKLGKLDEEVREEIEAEVGDAIDAWPGEVFNSN